MRTVLALLILALTATSVMSDCDGDNAYTLAAGFTSVSTSPGTTPAVATNCNFNTTVSGDKLCVDQTKVDSTIQAYIDDLIEELEGYATTRDQYIVDQRGDVIKALVSLENINEIAGEATLPEDARLFAGAFVDAAEIIAENFTAIVENFDSYRNERATCFNALITSQVALACGSLLDPVPTGIDLSDSNNPYGNFSNSFLGELNDACYTYFEYSQRQSSIILISVYSSLLTNVATYLEEVVANNTANNTAGIQRALTDLVTAFSRASSFSSDDSKKPTQLSEDCETKAGCVNWIEYGMFDPAGFLNQTVAIWGGEPLILVAPESNRILRERRLSGNGIVASLDKFSGFKVDFPKQPGNVDNTKNSYSPLRNGIVACAVAALALVF